MVFFKSILLCSREHFFFRAGDPHDILINFSELLRCGGVGVHRCRKMSADLFKILFVAGKVLLQFANILADLLGGLIDLHLAKSLERHLEVGIKRGGRNGVNAFFRGILDKIALGRGAHFVYEKVVIEGF